LESFPSLSSNPSYAFELIKTELTIRQELGQPIQPAQWYARFPQWSGQLQEWFQSHAQLAESVPPDQATVEQSPPRQRKGPAAEPLFGLLFGRYQVLAQLGRGGMGVVYKTRDTVLGRVVAVKMIGSGFLAQAREVERFYREARAVAQLSHPHIVPFT